MPIAVASARHDSARDAPTRTDARHREALIDAVAEVDEV